MDINTKKVIDATGPKFMPLKCPLCENIYKDQEWLSHHLRTIHKKDMPHRNVTPAYNFIEASAEVLKVKDSNNDSFTTDSLGRKIITEKVYPKTQKTFAQKLKQLPKQSIQCPICKSKSIHENQEWLVHHLKTVHKAKGYSCEILRREWQKTCASMNKHEIFEQFEFPAQI